MKIKNIRGWSAMLTVALLTVFVFTACAEKEDPFVPPPPPKEITVDAVGTVFAGQTGNNQITVQWEHSPSRDSSWFAGYELLVITPGGAGQTTTHIIGKDVGDANYSWFDTTDLNLDITYTFEVRARGNSVLNEGTFIKSSVKSTQWALATHHAQAFRIYTRRTSGTIGGSGFQIFGVETPQNRTIANGQHWQLALGSHDNLLIGSANAVVAEIGYTLTGTPTNNAMITTLRPIQNPGNDANDTDVLTDLLSSGDLAGLNYDNRTINLLTDPIAIAAQKGVIFYARWGTGGAAHYAKIVVKKSGAGGTSFLHTSGTGNNIQDYVEVLVSFQNRAGVPFAKPSL